MPKPTLLDRLLLKNLVPSARLLIVAGILVFVGGIAVTGPDFSFPNTQVACAAIALCFAGPIVCEWRHFGLDPFAERPLRALCAVGAWTGGILILVRAGEGRDPTASVVLLLVGGALAITGARRQAQGSAGNTPGDGGQRSLRALASLNGSMTVAFVFAATTTLVFFCANRYLDWPSLVTTIGLVASAAIAAVAALAAAYSGAQSGPIYARMRMTSIEAGIRFSIAALCVWQPTVMHRSPGEWNYWLGLGIAFVLLCGALVRLVLSCLPKEERT
ncbi:MAG: hypothetical protein JXA57_01225 [Armatimonadetes bacterium]|nr:hypothetical protein [Armatimonadota bacterium]